MLRDLMLLPAEQLTNFKTKLWEKTIVPYSQMVQLLLKKLTNKLHSANDFLTEEAIRLLSTNRHFKLTLFPDWTVNPLLAKIETMEEKPTINFHFRKPGDTTIEASFAELQAHAGEIAAYVAEGREHTLTVDLDHLLWFTLVSYVQLVDSNAELDLYEEQKSALVEFNTADCKFENSLTVATKRVDFTERHLSNAFNSYHPHERQGHHGTRVRSFQRFVSKCE